MEESKHQRKHHNVTMVEFYDYRLQHRNTNGIALLWGGQYRQQYIVDAYAVVEQNCLRYLCLNQKNFVQISIKAFRTPSLQVIITLLPSDRGSFCHLLSQEVHITWFRISKMPWQSVDGPVARICLLHSLAIPNGMRSKERCCPDNNLRID